MCAIKMAGNDIIVTIFFKISDPLTDGTVMNRDDFCDLLGRHASLEELEGEAVAFSFGFTGEGAGVGAGHQRDLSCQVPSGKRSNACTRRAHPISNRNLRGGSVLSFIDVPAADAASRRDADRRCPQGRPRCRL